MTSNEDLLREFLSMPLDRGTEILEKFAALPGAKYEKGELPTAAYVYVPGTRKDRVLLTAHVDTVWDSAYQRPHTGSHALIYENGVFRSGEPGVGIGADDRAGCAMLWALRNSGHSLLLTNGEEHGKAGVKLLMENRRLFRKINRSRWMLALDWVGTDSCLFYGVENTELFKRYIQTKSPFCDSKVNAGCDLFYLCKKVCGVNIGVGYHRYHKETECLSVNEWEHTFDALTTLLQQPQRRFRLSIPGRLRRLGKTCRNKVIHILVKVKHALFLKKA